MSTNDYLASIAGLIDATEAINHGGEVVNDEDDEINYEDADDLLDALSFENQHVEESSSRRGRLNIRELQGLEFKNAGAGTSKFLPQSSDIVNTNRSRRNYTDKQAELREENIHHDKNGKLSCTTKGQTETFDLCDCLNSECGGCHWPCETCGSRKCLIQCRQNRKEMIAKVEDMYTPEGEHGHFTRTNPYFPIQIKENI